METVSIVFAWLNANPAWAGVGVFLIAFFESLAVVGLILPGAAMMFGIGALVGTDTLALWPTLAWAAAGAIMGDGVSFWLGRRYHRQLKGVWPLRNHPDLLNSATEFFYRHGGKSILLGRFVGPIRPVIPAVAGMLEMPAKRFVAFNVVSGLLWAPVYVFPGILFATSLGLASEVASRLAVVIGSVLGLLFVVLWLLRLLFSRLHRHAYPLIQRTLAWARLHPVAGQIPASLLDPEQPEARGLTWLALLLLLTTTLFALVVQASSHAGLLFNLDSYLLHTAETLRTPVMNHLFAGLTLLGDWQVLLPLSLLIAAWLWRRGYHHAVKHWLAAAGLGALLSLNLLWLEPTGESAMTAPLHSGQLMTAVAVYGFLAVLIGWELSEKRRWYVYAAAAALILVIAIARLYLGASRLSGVLGALTLGLAWVSLLGIGYRNHPAERVTVGRLGAITLVGLLVTTSWHGVQHYQQTLQRHAPEVDTEQMEMATWWQGGWQELAAYRSDLRGYNNHPLNLQYAGALSKLSEALLAQGWRHPKAVGLISWLAWLNPDTPLALLPVLPQVHDGENETLLLVRDDSEKHRMLALRLWASPYRLDGKRALWVGNITRLVPLTQNGFTVPRTGTDFDTPRQRLVETTLPFSMKWVMRKEQSSGWDGGVLLLREQ